MNDEWNKSKLSVLASKFFTNPFEFSTRVRLNAREASVEFERRRFKVDLSMVRGLVRDKHFGDE